MTATARERIIEAALTLITERGLSGVTMVAVAENAGVARATLYNHYPDVPTILAEAVTVHNEHATAGLRQALHVVASPPAAIEQLVRYVASISIHGHTIQTHHGLPPELRTQLDAFDLELETQIRQMLTDGITTGDFRGDLDLDATVTLLRHALNGVSELVAATPANAADIVANTLPTILAAITTSRGPSPTTRERSVLPHTDDH